MLAKFQATFMTHGFSCVQNEKKTQHFLRKSQTQISCQSNFFRLIRAQGPQISLHLYVTVEM
jgi:hypothetical protein